MSAPRHPHFAENASLARRADFGGSLKRGVEHLPEK
jgi:hypothetical protein